MARMASMTDEKDHTSYLHWMKMISSSSPDDENKMCWKCVSSTYFQHGKNLPHRGFFRPLFYLPKKTWPLTGIVFDKVL